MVDLDTRLLRSFAVVAREGTITGAAARLHIAQQALSAQVQQLERAVGATLLVRTTRGVRLTRAGDELLAGIKPLLCDLDAVLSRVRATAGGRLGRLRLVCKPHATAEFALDVVQAMERDLPGIELELVTVSTLPEELAALREGTADVSFLWVPTGDERLRSARVRRDRRVVALPSGHPFAARDALSLAELADEPVIVPQVVVSEDVVRHWLAEPRPDGRPAVRGPAAHRIEDRLMLVARGRGVWFAPEPLARYFPLPGVVWVPVTDVEPSYLAVVWMPGAPEALIAHLVEHVRGLTGWGDRDGDRNRDDDGDTGG
ncbi:LysR family transcriptional regulator [Actinospica robiniae]|uniref:LysR family transcriptional regulator n=1 Tax=Actinospica robiniae TaxID=304901 RepID=UPI000687F1FB|nr:LysR family transcriptional regulator [Actinospica robiniae]